MLTALLFSFLFSLLETPPTDVASTFEEAFRSGLLALQRGDLPAATSALEAASKQQPRNPRVWIALAQVSRKSGDSTKADAAAGKASEFGAKDPIVQKSLAIYYSEAGQFLKAADFQTQFALMTPSDRSAAEAAASLYFQASQPLLKQERFGDVVEILERAKAKLPPNPQVLLGLGVAFYGLRRFDESADALLSVIAVAPEEKTAYRFLGKMLDQIPQRLPEATDRFAAFEKAHPDEYEGYLLHAKALNAQSKDPELTGKLLEKAIALNGADASTHFEFGALLDRMRRFSEAATEFERAAALDPSDAVIHYRLSRIYERLNKPELAAMERERHRKLVTAQNAR